MPAQGATSSVRTFMAPTGGITNIIKVTDAARASNTTQAETTRIVEVMPVRGYPYTTEIERNALIAPYIATIGSLTLLLIKARRMRKKLK